MPGLSPPPPPQIEEVWRREAPYVLAALQRRGATLADAEDAAQEALLAAAGQWPVEGTPGSPRGWLIRVASRRLIDSRRAEESRARREHLVAQERALTWSDRAGDNDDSLQMLVLCCHPALTPTSAVALTLRAVSGLSTPQIAAALLVNESAAAQRIRRAKATLVRAEARLGRVAPGELPARLHAVRHVLHLVFTTGSGLPAGADLIDGSMTREAIRVVEVLHRSLPRDPETAGLLALMYLVEARAGARSIEGRLIPLADQDRNRWDTGLIARGVELLEQALPRGPVGPFQLQAAIAAVHATAATFAETDWPQIRELYRMLLALGPNPAAELGHAIAVGEIEGAAAGLRALDGLAESRPGDHRILAARAHLLARLGHPDAAATFRRAAELTDSVPEQGYLRTQAQSIERPRSG